MQGEQGEEALFGGAFAIFGHGNVAGLGEALYQYRDVFPTYRAHNEQGMALAAIAYAKTHMRRRMMAVTSSIGPGATNLLTAAALAHVNRLPVLLLPGDMFITRAPDPVLQQLEDTRDGTVSVNDAFKPLSRYFDRITHPEQLLTALPRAIQALTDAALCGPVTLALPQDVQAEAYDYPVSFFSPQTIVFRALPPVEAELEQAAALLRTAKKPLIVSGGGVLYSRASSALRLFAELHGIPVVETHAGKSALPWDHPLQLGAIGVDGSVTANQLASQADVILAVGTRLQDFTTGSNSLFGQARLINLNVSAFDAIKRRGLPVMSDARLGLQRLSGVLSTWQSDSEWQSAAYSAGVHWRATVDAVTARRSVEHAADGSVILPYDGDVIGAVQRSSAHSAERDIVVCAAGTLPAELKKLWRTSTPGGYHMEYGFSCMGYELAGGLGIKMAKPEAEVIVMVGDGSYLMMNSEIATSVLLGKKLIIVVLDNRGYGCINRLQQAVGCAPFNNMFVDSLQGEHGAPDIDFAMHARSLGAHGENVHTIAELEQAMTRARAADRTYLVCINTDDKRSTQGGCWWEVAVPEVSEREQVRQAHLRYQDAKAIQRKVQ